MSDSKMILEQFVANEVTREIHHVEFATGACNLPKRIEENGRWCQVDNLAGVRRMGFDLCGHCFTSKNNHLAYTETIPVENLAAYTSPWPAPPPMTSLKTYHCPCGKDCHFSESPCSMDCLTHHYTVLFERTIELMGNLGDFVYLLAYGNITFNRQLVENWKTANPNTMKDVSQLVAAIYKVCPSALQDVDKVKEIEKP